MEKELKVYQVILFCCGLLLGTLMAYASNLNNKIEKLEEASCDSVTCEIGNDVENFILDVVYETDLFYEITEEEQKYLDELEEDWYGRYCIELIMLYQKYYGDK